MEIAGSVADDFARGVTHYPFLAGGIMVGWALLIGIGLLLRRRRFWRAWPFEWLIWTYLLTGLILDLLIGGAQIADPNEWTKPPLWDFISNLVLSVGIGLLWPVFEGALLLDVVTSERGSGEQVFAIGLTAGTLAIGAALAFGIATAHYGLPRFVQTSREHVNET